MMKVAVVLGCLAVLACGCPPAGVVESVSFPTPSVGVVDYRPVVVYPPVTAEQIAAVTEGHRQGR